MPKTEIEIAYSEFEIACDRWSAGGFIGSGFKEQAAHRVWKAYEKLVDDLNLGESLTKQEKDTALSAGSYLGKYL